MQHRSRKGGALKEPATQPAGQISCTVGQAGDLERGSGHVSWWIQSVQPCGKGEILKQSEVVVKKRLMREESNIASDVTGGPVEGLTKYANGAGGWSCESRKQSQERAFAGPVGANYDERFTRSEREINAMKDAHSTECTAESTSLEHKSAVMRWRQFARRARRGGMV